MRLPLKIMYALISREKTQLIPGTVVRMPGSWEDYCTLCGSRGDSSIPRIKYRVGEVLLMSPINLQAIVTRCLQTANERGTGVAIRELRQRLSDDVLY